MHTASTESPRRRGGDGHDENPRRETPPACEGLLSVATPARRRPIERPQRRGLCPALTGSAGPAPALSGFRHSGRPSEPSVASVARWLLAGRRWANVERPKRSPPLAAGRAPRPLRRLLLLVCSHHRFSRLSLLATALPRLHPLVVVCLQSDISLATLPLPAFIAPPASPVSATLVRSPAHARRSTQTLNTTPVCHLRRRLGVSAPRIILCRHRRLAQLSWSVCFASSRPARSIDCLEPHPPQRRRVRLCPSRCVHGHLSNYIAWFSRTGRHATPTKNAFVASQTIA
jgi:hypothetical protein